MSEQTIDKCFNCGGKNMKLVTKDVVLEMPEQEKLNKEMKDEEIAMKYIEDAERKASQKTAKKIKKDLERNMGFIQPIVVKTTVTITQEDWVGFWKEYGVSD